MNKPEGKLRLAVAKPFLIAILVCIPLSATFCRAQCFVFGPQWYSINSATMTPSVWTAGQTYTVTVTQPNPQQGYFVQGNCTVGTFVGPATDWNQFYGWPDNWTPDPNVTVSNLTFVSSTTITFVVALGPNANRGDCWVQYSGSGVLSIRSGVMLSATNLGPCDKDCQTQAGAPINVTTGNVWVQQRDYSVPGLGGGLPLVRTWNSLFGGAAANIYGMFGLYWVFTYIVKCKRPKRRMPWGRWPRIPTTVPAVWRW